MTLDLPEDLETFESVPVLRETLRITVVNTSDRPWNEVCFRDYMASVIAEDNARSDQPSNFQSGILSARCAGEALAVQPDEKDPSIVYISLAAPLAPSKSAVLELEYKADVPIGEYRTSAFPLTQQNSGNTGITVELSQFYPMLAIMENGDWMCDPYITKDECFYTQCADFDIALHVPENYLVASSGDETLDGTSSGKSI